MPPQRNRLIIDCRLIPLRHWLHTLKHIAAVGTSLSLFALDLSPTDSVFSFQSFQPRLDRLAVELNSRSNYLGRLQIIKISILYNPSPGLKRPHQQHTHLYKQPPSKQLIWSASSLRRPPKCASALHSVEMAELVRRP